MELVRNLPQRPDHFRMAGMADQNQIHTPAYSRG